MQHNNLGVYYKELRSTFGDVDGVKVALLKVAVLIYPLLKAVGIKILHPIAIVAENDMQLNQIYDELAGFSKEIPLPLSLGRKELQNRYENSEFGTFRTKYTGGRKCDENLSFMTSLCQLEHSERCITLSGFCGGIESCSLESVEGVIYLQEFSEVQVNGENRQIEFTKLLVEFVEMNQSIIFHRIREKLVDDCQFEADEQNALHKLFRCAECVIELLVEEILINQEERSRELHFVECAMQDILNNLDYLHVQDTIWKKQFVEMLYKSVSQIPRILNRECIESCDLDKIGKLPMYDEKYYYLPETLLREICQTWLTYMNFSRLRVLLANEGIIQTEGKNRKYYTIKTPVITVYGAVKYVRLMKIPRCEIDTFGELTWCEVLLMEEREDESDD